MSDFDTYLQQVPQGDMRQSVIDVMDTFFIVEKWFDDNTHKVATTDNIVDLTKMILERENQLKNAMVME